MNYKVIEPYIVSLAIVWVTPVGLAKGRGSSCIVSVPH